MRIKLRNAIRIAIASVIALTITNINGIKTSAAIIASQTRYSGSTRMETAVEISKAGWTSSQNVVLAYAYDFPDALSGVPLALLKDAPILLTDKTSIPTSTMNEIKRLNASNIYILGSSGVVSDSVQNSLTSTGYTVTRLGGIDRFETSLKIADKVNSSNSSHTAVISIFDNYPDALSISPYAAMKHIPILYTEANSLEAKTRAWLKNNGITNVIISGGTGVISQNVENQLTSDGMTVQRLAGADRYLTALNIVKTFQSSFNSNFMLATGEDFPDALAGGVLAAKTQTPILLTQDKSMEEDVKDYLDSKSSLSFFVLGGTGVIQSNINNYFGKLIVVDPGHDYGADYGAVGNGYAETDLNMQVALKVKASLEARGNKVVLTRQAWDRPVSTSLSQSLQSRTDLANGLKADLFISIHHDKSDSSSVTGVSAHYSTYRPNIDTSGVITGDDPYGWYSGVYIDTTPSNAAIVSRNLATTVVNDLSSKMGYNNRYAHDHNLFVTKNTNMPSILVECGFLSNYDEATRSANSDNQAKIGEVIGDAVQKTLNN
ncbi:cell wall-binding repeat-containing protein [Clostridium sp. 'White wine YQ']|uniref:cell wall-binding repeat-containing protein n=1 Tax=Clostridium sp. 'White wine YQ' TaxID=3027474 RepID=UPI0023650BA4|nr:cell wall-binding repeat-containing protein [Clostridium sp. 'White wine YQ']MDD7794478.1 cell wall-binding repeat-containing protein [Clostridium sp. 'White wine YQ']